MDAVAQDVQLLDCIGGRELRVDEDEVAPLSFACIDGVHAHGSGVKPLREMQRSEIVDHRCAQPRALRRPHPVAEMENVETAQEALGGWPSDGAPGSPCRVREGDRDGAPLSGQSVQRCVQQLPAVNAHGAEGDDLVPAACLEHPGQRTEDVVADARSRMREGRDVVGDPHGAL